MYYFHCQNINFSHAIFQLNFSSFEGVMIIFSFMYLHLVGAARPIPYQQGQGIYISGSFWWFFFTWWISGPHDWFFLD